MPENFFEQIKGKIFATPKKIARTELGGTGTPIFGGIIDTSEYVEELKDDKLIDTVNKMRWSDASVSAALQVCMLPILSAEWDIEPASEDPQDVEIAEIVKKNLFEGMSTTWQDSLRQALLMLAFGHYVFEVIYKEADGLFLWKKWAPRLPKTIKKWNTEKGSLVSIEQQFYREAELKTVTIPIEKLLIFIHKKEGDNWKGTSTLRQAYKHWFFRDKYYKIDAIATERHGVGIPIIYLPEGYKPEDKLEAEELGKNLRVNEQAYITFPSRDWSIEMLDMKTATIKDPKEMLDHHTREILKSVLAEFVELGAGKTGSWALSRNKTGFFLDALDSVAKNIEDTINNYAIKRLVDLNWTVEEYPKLTHGDIGMVDIEQLANAIQSLTLVGGITPDPELETYLRVVMNLPEKPEMGVTETTPAPKTEELETETKVEEETPDKASKAKMSERWHRQLTKAEQAVRFDEIKRVMDSEEKRLFNELVKILVKEKVALLPAFERAVQNHDLAKLQNIAGRFKGEYERVFRNGIKKLYEFGKNKASYEIKLPAPSTTGEQVGMLSDHAHYYAERHYKDLVDNLKSVASLGVLDKSISDLETIKNIKAAYQKFINRNVSITANLSVAESFNAGRKFTFDTYKDDVYGFQWSAILDGATCNYCRSMDGRVISSTDKKFNEYQPGKVHFNCRCIWVAIMKDEAKPPAFSGIPDQLRPQTEVPPWGFKDLNAPLPGSSKLDIGERLYKPQVVEEQKVLYGQDTFKDYPGLPKDVIWRTIGGKRVPISPKTGKPVERGGGGGDGKKEEVKKDIFDRGITQDTEQEEEFAREELDKYHNLNATLSDWFVRSDEKGKKAVVDYFEENQDAREVGLFNWYQGGLREAAGGDLTFDQWMKTTVTVYRGTGKEDYKSKYFLSYSPERKIAEKFARMYGGSVVEKKVKVSDIIGYNDIGGEAEVMVK